MGMISRESVEKLCNLDYFLQNKVLNNFMFMYKNNEIVTYTDYSGSGLALLKNLIAMVNFFVGGQY